MRALMVGVWMVACALTGCAAEVVSEDEALVRRVAALGYGTDIEIDGDIVRVNGDIILHRDRLLRGDYEVAVAESDGGVVEKGYRYASIVSTANIKTAKLAWAKAPYAPSTAVKNAFIDAAGDYNSIANCDLTLSQNNPGPATITVHQVGALSWPGASGCPANVPACAEAPSKGSPGTKIWIKGSNPFPSCLNWTATALGAMARHELGHAYGFAHPKEAGSTRITGTAACTGTAATCLAKPGYSSIMATITVNTACGASPSLLQTDDRASAAVLY